jgi:bacterioferritin (cytochrome b1)
VQEPEKLFTQEDVNRIVQERLKRERRKREDLRMYIAYLEARLQENKGSDKR